ncbi:MAG: hypothetical protein NVS3B24_21100 [Candidatus Dormibacteria bacterium]
MNRGLRYLLAAAVLMDSLLAGCSAGGASVAIDRPVIAAQDLSFDGAITGRWDRALVVQCEVTTAGGSHPVPVYSAFLKANIGSETYHLSVGLLNYSGSGRYVGSFPTGPSVAILYRGAPTRANALGEFDGDQQGVLVVDGDQSGGIIDAYFAPSLDAAVIAKTGQFVDPDPARRVHVHGKWSCGKFPIRAEGPRPGGN